MRSSWLLVLLLCLLPALVGCAILEKLKGGGDDDSAGRSDASDDDSADASTVPVRAEPARRGLLETTVRSSSTVESVQSVDMMTEVSGTVTAVSVEEGARVGNGHVLARLDSPLQKGERDRSLASYRKAEEDLERLQSLHDKGFISENEWNEAVHAHDLARTTYEQAQAALDDTILRAPFSGTVAYRDIEVGENVSVGKRVFQVVDLSRLEVEIHLAERYLTRIAVGQKARVTSEFTELVTEGEVLRIAPTVDSATGTVKVTVAVRQEGVVLRPGMFVNVDVVTETHEQALLIPKRALVYEDGEPVVYVVREGLSARVPLGPGQEQGDEREVAEGIEEGELVIVMGQTALKDGAAVSIAAVNGSGEADGEAEGAPPEDGQDKNVEAE